jgi:8-oxo-dGTP pyrophosphatase MutT (NUDIX family)
MTEIFAYPVVSIIVEHPTRSDLILLQKRTKDGAKGLRNLFELPQGRLRMGESFVECASRELHEETGLTNFRCEHTVSTSDILGETLEMLNGTVVVETGVHSYLAICVVGKADGAPRSSAESSDPSWYSEAEVLQLIDSQGIFPLNVPMLRGYYSSRRRE